MTLILPGFSIINKIEAESIKIALESNGEQVLLHEWRHWSNESIEWNTDQEIEIIKSKLNTTLPISIVAKSIGTAVAAELVQFLNVQNIVLLGIPVNDIDIGKHSIYQNFKGKNITVIQNNDDSHGTVEQVQSLLKGVDYKLIGKPSSTHNYPYVQDVINALALK